MYHIGENELLKRDIVGTRTEAHTIEKKDHRNKDRRISFDVLNYLSSFRWAFFSLTFWINTNIYREWVFNYDVYTK
jgi:hypothetical protein